ncbi:MAG: hypothetical protein IE927_13300 [Rhodobacterales bacterium]|nr:hypothetical protein [Rhodobacterales bacterium]
MSSGFVPASPLGDLAAWAAQGPGSGLLTPDLVALAQSGVGITLAGRLADGRPVAGLGLGCRVLPCGTLRVPASGPAIAALVATRAAVRPALSDDLPEVDRQCAVLADGLVEIGFSRDLARGYVAHDPASLIALEFRPERVFTQTPGPGAGAELTR